jgi:hypothetical protein
MTKLVHCNKEPYDVYIGRPSKFGNPFTHIKNKETLAEFVVGSRKEALEKYREYILNNQELLDSLHELDGKILGCWCFDENSPSDEYVCHGQILIELINSEKIKKCFEK